MSIRRRMEALISNLVNQFERGTLSRRQLVQSLVAVAAAGSAAARAAFTFGTRGNSRPDRPKVIDVVSSVISMHDQIYDNICQAIGKTPVVRLNRIPQKGWPEMLVKLESFNPGGSVKDRIGFSMIEAAERDGKLKPGGTIVEPTSGNTGIGLAMVAAAKGYKVILTMPEEYSVERITLLRAYGAQVVLTPREYAMQGAIDKAEELVRKNPDYFMPQQFKNPANPEIHRETTAKEILEVCGDKLDALVVGVGTGGTATGAGEALKQKFKSLKVFAVEPADSPVFSGGRPGPHKIQGIGAGFIP